MKYSVLKKTIGILLAIHMVTSHLASQINLSTVRILGESDSEFGVVGISVNNIAIYGSSTNLWGIGAFSSNHYGIHASSSTYHGAKFSGKKGAGFADIVLGARGDSSADDNGVIMSDPTYPGSDIFLVGNDAVVARIDNNNNGTGNFLVHGANSEELFRVNHNGDVLVKGSTVHGSDRNRKENITDISQKEILRNILEMPIYEWQYKGQDRRHIGPMAQDFHKAFGLGDDDKSIAAIDADGVTLAAIKAQQEIIEKQNGKINSLEKEMESMKKEISKLKDLVSTLVSQTKAD